MILDHAVVRALRQWRFKPGVFTAVATPVAFTMGVLKPKT
jgi:outer membrane biosynthesis protein TonB